MNKGDKCFKIPLEGHARGVLNPHGQRTLLLGSMLRFWFMNVGITGETHWAPEQLPKTKMDPGSSRNPPAYSTAKEYQGSTAPLPIHFPNLTPTVGSGSTFSQEAGTRPTMSGRFGLGFSLPSLVSRPFPLRCLTVFFLRCFNAFFLKEPQEGRGGAPAG